jgi:hypothetical protein
MLANDDVHAGPLSRLGPRCYSRQGEFQVIDQVRTNAAANAALVILSAITFIAAFALVYGGWGI